MPEMKGQSIPPGLTVVAMTRSALADLPTASAIEHVVIWNLPAKPLPSRRSLTFAATAVEVAMPDPHARRMLTISSSFRKD